MCETSKKSPPTNLSMHHMKVFPTRMKDENNEKTKNDDLKNNFLPSSPSWMPKAGPKEV